MTAVCVSKLVGAADKFFTQKICITAAINAMHKIIVANNSINVVAQ